MLIQQGANVNSRDNMQKTAVALASFEGKTQALELLLRAKADVNCLDQVLSSTLSSFLPSL
ncbi:hypothetical protein BKA69DRAFT_1090621 [Paraphysoderma sedebokerense]|nr:hypothetical protein BKA69DRAFT_1090612 [Paraphysoderma sedebokerense]KAI9138674.1 hypothetical protein BKA69DRAFT_1090621 [Paraphysoderma sedebokerense]